MKHRTYDRSTFLVGVCKLIGIAVILGMLGSLSVFLLLQENIPLSYRFVSVFLGLIFFSNISAKAELIYLELVTIQRSK